MVTDRLESRDTFGISQGERRKMATRSPRKATKGKGKGLPRGITMRTGNYRVRVSYEGRQYECGIYETLELAKLALHKYQAECILGTFVPPVERRRQLKAMRAANAARNVTVAQWSQTWIESLATGPKPRSPGTIASYQSTVNSHILPSLGNKPLTDVTPDDIEDCVATAMQSGAGASRNVARTLRAMFNAAVAIGAGGLESSPVKLKISKGTSNARQDEEVPSLEEVNGLAAAMPPDTRLAVLLAAWCSLRVGEVLGLQRGDFKHLDEPGKTTVTIERQWLSKAKPPAYGPPKDDSYRTVVVPAALARKVQAHLDRYVLPNDEAPVFHSSLDSARPMSHNSIGKRWREARAKVRPGTDFHALRHFGLTVYAQAGATQTEIMRRGGHRDADVAQRYQHSSLERDQLLTARLNDIMEGQS